MDAFAKGLEVVRESPLVDGHFHDGSAALGKFGQEFGIRSAVLLEGDAEVSERIAEVVVDGSEQLVPGGRFSGGGYGAEVVFAKNRFWLGSARNDADRAECCNESLALIPRFNDL